MTCATYRILAELEELKAEKEFGAEAGRTLDFGDLTVNLGP